MQKTAVIIAATGLILLLIAVAYAALTLQIPSQGIIDTNTSTLQATPSTLDWGALAPNQQATRNVTLINTAATATHPLTMTASPTVGVLIWNQEGSIIQPGQSIACTFTLQVSASPPLGAFSFNITITG